MDAAAKFLNGDGDGGELPEDASQDDVDAMFAADADVDEAAPEPEPLPELATDSAPNGNGSDEPEAETDDDQPKLDDIVTLAADGSETALQDDIDALFD